MQLVHRSHAAVDVVDYACSSWRRPIYLQGWLYIFERHICWNPLAPIATLLKIPISDVVSVRRDAAFFSMGSSMVVATNANEVRFFFF